ncbi:MULTISPECIES: hypothetical protein [unclassified Chitinophaga]|uniref:hypothetical protein n=1 Tax=unclassified Chitinophaga TaxID=2619133 RepID=UPI00300FA562
MKRILTFSFLISVVLFSCSKDEKAKGPSNEEILTKKIADIIPQKYLDTLKLLGLNVHEGVNPPNVEGTYKIAPHKLDSSNVPGDRPGSYFSDALVTFSEQSTTDYSIKLTGKNFLSYADTSIATAISGSGNNFTVYGKVKAVNGTYSAVFALVFTGTKEGNDLKNVRVAIINIDNSRGGSGIFIQEGTGRIGFDEDGTSPKVAEKSAPESGGRSAFTNTLGHFLQQ